MTQVCSCLTFWYMALMDLSSFAVLRWCVQGKGDFSMEYKAHVPVAQHLQEELIAELRTQRAARDASS